MQKFRIKNYNCNQYSVSRLCSCMTVCSHSLSPKTDGKRELQVLFYRYVHEAAQHDPNPLQGNLTIKKRHSKTAECVVAKQ